jgi:hypothetical protein
MQHVPFKKVQKELGRAALRLWDAGIKPLRQQLTRLHDRQRDRRVIIHPGHLDRAAKVAIYVIYQPDSLRASTLVTCDWLARNGYAPLVVSNAPLAPEDLHALASRSWLVVSRPNVGYDFGAYRDGFWVLSQQGANPDRVLLLNDSVWIPIVDDQRMLQAIEATPGFSGPVFVASSGRSVRNAHFQSYLLALDTSAARHPALLQFWKRYPVSNARRVVLSEGEKGLSQAAIAAGLVADPKPTRTAMYDRIRSQDTKMIACILRYAAYENRHDAEAGRLILAQDDGSYGWRQSALDHIRKVLDRGQPMGCFPVAAVLLMGFNFLKKGNNLSVYAGMRRQYLRAVRDGILPKPCAEILAEVEGSRMDGRWTTDVGSAETP